MVTVPSHWISCELERLGQSQVGAWRAPIPSGGGADVHAGLPSAECVMLSQAAPWPQERFYGPTTVPWHGVPAGSQGCGGLWRVFPWFWITSLCKPCMGECMSPPPKADKIVPQTIEPADGKSWHTSLGCGGRKWYLESGTQFWEPALGGAHVRGDQRAVLPKGTGVLGHHDHEPSADQSGHRTQVCEFSLN